jgi:hypothetical protein
MVGNECAKLRDELWWRQPILFLTDNVIQRLVREEFGGWAIITVAYRLENIIGSDRILVLDQGQVVENGGPDELLAKRGAFWGLSGETKVGIGRYIRHLLAEFNKSLPLPIVLISPC